MAILWVLISPAMAAAGGGRRSAIGGWNNRCFTVETPGLGSSVRAVLSVVTGVEWTIVFDPGESKISASLPLVISCSSATSPINPSTEPLKVLFLLASCSCKLSSSLLPLGVSKRSSSSSDWTLAAPLSSSAVMD